MITALAVPRKTAAVLSRLAGVLSRASRNRHFLEGLRLMLVTPDPKAAVAIVANCSPPPGMGLVFSTDRFFRLVPPVAVTLTYFGNLGSRSRLGGPSPCLSRYSLKYLVWRVFAGMLSVQRSCSSGA